MTDELDRSKKPSKRSFGMFMLIVFFVVIALIGWLRMQQALSHWQNLDTLHLYPGTAYIVVSGAVMGLVGSLTAAALWSRKSWAIILTDTAAAVFTCWYWIDDVFFSVTSYSQHNRLFKLMLTMIGLVFVILIPYFSHRNGYFLDENTRDRG